MSTEENAQKLVQAMRQAQKSADDWEAEHGVAHHGAPILTRRDEALCHAMATWIATARASNGYGYGKDWLPSGVDIIKSRLFWRCRSGKNPLPHRPPTAYSCPWYELIDEADKPHWAYDMHEHGNEVYVAQCRYQLIERGADGQPARLAFGPWQFKVWRGPSPYSNRSDGWWIQVDESKPRDPSTGGA